ncbi:MAG: ABC transporter ATP-binding protein [Actinomycetota bacterium]
MANRPNRPNRPKEPDRRDAAFAPRPTVEVEEVSAWFGQKVALSELSCSFGAGVTGLLGPNGAGKTTLLRVVTGLLPASTGRVRVAGGDPRADARVRAALALVPEDEAVPGPLTPRQLVEYRARLFGVGQRDAPEQALAEVGLTDVADRRLEGFSKGMRQRAKVAAALVTSPSVLVLDEPLNGADPVQRVSLINLFRSLGDQGRTVIVSSHVLHEVERLGERIVVLVNGRLAAAGDRRAIREAMVDRPRRVLVRASAARSLGAALVGHEAVTGVSLEGDVLTVATSRAGELAVALPPMARAAGSRLREVRPLDESLEAIFRDLVR